MKFITGILLILLSFSWSASAKAGTLAEYMETRKIYAAAAACMASYSSRTGSLAVAAFEQEGWKIEPNKLVGKETDARYLLAWNPNSKLDHDIYLLAVGGTENAKDAKVDMRTSKVYFAGSTVEEFAVNAAKKDLPPDVPRVHEGFNQATQLLLSAGTTQANDSKAGTLRTIANILREDHNDKVYLVGHSLGGAVVTLLAARLIDLGVKSSQIEVVTFGAPEVGNEAFVKQYDGKFVQTRIVNQDDPVPYALRKVYGGYRHIGPAVEWPIPDDLKSYFSHDMPVYLDLAIKNYYPKRRAAFEAGLIPQSEPIEGKNRLYVASIKNSLPPELQSEIPYMQEALWTEYDRISPGSVVDTGEPSSLTNLEKAAAAGCTLVVAPEIQAVRVREANAYYVSLNQTVYRVSDGVTLNVGLYGSSTKEWTPMDALIHNARLMSRESSSWADAK
jgi:hypothetical protein